MASIPKILIRINQENRWLQRFREGVELDAVISDNRYGLWGKGLYSVFITHQLGMRTSLGAWVDRWVQGWHYRLIGRHSAVWVPDQEEGMGLAGALSHPGRLPAPPTRYVGILSRMEGAGDRGEFLEEGGELAGGEIDLLILLSGPEPQRTILERRLWAQSGAFTGRVVFVRGLPRGGGEVLSGLPNVAVHDHLPAGVLNEVMLKAKLILARTGYSTVMDLVRLGKRAILIPTPGQTEQAYLGKYLMEKKIAFCSKQAGFSLMDAVARAEEFPYAAMREKGGLLQDAVTALLEKINPSPLPI